MSDLKSILDRLLRENLHGPIDSGNDSNSPENQAIRQAATVAGQTPGTDRHQDQGNPYQQVKDQDLDAHDPRWRELFNEFFVSDQSDDKHDDLLFFVQRASYEIENGGLGVDPVFVKRKVKGGQRVLTAQQEAVVLWKDTFFLNVIVQLQCKLTVAVCTREALRDPKTGEKKSSITTRKFVSKRVYASPTKSRMDVKEESVECSWPLIYYVIDDFEDSFEQLMLQENEHLCVELAVELPTTNPTSPRSKQESGAQRDHHAGGQHADKVQVGRPFPTGSSRGGSKIMLFQGAVGFSNLLGIYQQKAASKVGRRFKLGPHTVPTEFIMMRGPRGRGHAQVAITASNFRDNPSLAYVDNRNASNPTSPTSPTSPSSPFRETVSYSEKTMSHHGIHTPRTNSSNIIQGMTHEKTLPPIPNAHSNGHGNVYSQHHGNGTGNVNGNAQSYSRSSPRVQIPTSVPLPSPTSPRLLPSSSNHSNSSPPPRSFTAGSFFQSLRRISLATLAQAAGTLSNNETNNSNNNFGQIQGQTKSTYSLGSQSGNSPTSPTGLSSGFSGQPVSSSSSIRNGVGTQDGVGSRQDIEALVKQPQSLRCSMTFVNVPWTGIAAMLMEHASHMESQRRRMRTNGYGQRDG